MSPKQQEALAAYEKYGSYQKAADALGIGKSTVQDLCKRARAWQGTDPSVQQAASELGIEDMSIVRDGWLKGKSASFRIDVKKEDDGKTLLENIHEAFSSLKPRKPIAAPASTEKNLCTFYNIIDHHLAMNAWGKETGDDYDLKIAIDRLTESMASLIESTPKSDVAVVLNLGDFFHAHDDTATTKQSGHNLDVDGRHYKVLLAGVDVTVACIDMAAKKHKKVIYRALRGNHDEGPHAALTVALYHHYRDCPNIEIDMCASDFYSFEWGRNMICGHHGDKAKADRLVLFMADNWPEMWGRTHWRFLWTGHIHHDSAKDIGGVSWESFRTLAPKDAYAASHAFSSRQTMQAITLDKEHGEILRNKVQIIPPRFH